MKLRLKNGHQGFTGKMGLKGLDFSVIAVGVFLLAQIVGAILVDLLFF